MLLSGTAKGVGSCLKALLFASCTMCKESTSSKQQYTNGHKWQSANTTSTSVLGNCDRYIPCRTWTRKFLTGGSDAEVSPSGAILNTMSPVVTVNIVGIAPACCTACPIVLLPKLSGTEVVRDSSLDGAACQTVLEEVCCTNTETKISVHHTPHIGWEKGPEV